MASKEAIDMWTAFIGLLMARRYMRTMREALHAHKDEGIINQAIGLYRPSMICKGEEDLVKQNGLVAYEVDPDTVARAVRHAQALIELIGLP